MRLVQVKKKSKTQTAAAPSLSSTPQKQVRERAGGGPEEECHFVHRYTLPPFGRGELSSLRSSPFRSHPLPVWGLRLRQPVGGTYCYHASMLCTNRRVHHGHGRFPHPKGAGKRVEKGREDVVVVTAAALVAW